MHQRNAHEFYFDEPEPEEREKAVWKQIDSAFALPVSRDDDPTAYVPTQIIAEVFKNEGYDGVAYKSALKEDGFNIALFKLDDARVTWCATFDASSLQYSFKQSGNPYWVGDDGSLTTMSIDAVGPAEVKEP